MAENSIAFSLTHEFVAGLDLERKLAAMKSAGFDYVNISSGGCRRLLAAGADERAAFRNQLKSHDLQVDWFHSPYVHPAPYSADGEIWAVSVAVHRASLYAAAELQARAVIVHPINIEFPADQSFEQSYVQLDRAFRVLIEDGDRYGVRVAVENMPDSASHSLVSRLLDSIDGLGLCFDTGHAHITATWLLYLDRYASRICALHLHDNDGSGDQHLVPGQGVVDFDDLARRLVEADYEGVWGIECEQKIGGYEGDAHTVASQAYEAVHGVVMNAKGGVAV